MIARTRLRPRYGQRWTDAEGLVLAFDELSMDDRKLVAIRDKGRRGVRQSIDALRRLKVLPKPPGMFEMCVSAFAHGFVMRPDRAVEERLNAEAQANAIQSEIRNLIAGFHDLQIAKLLLHDAAPGFSGAQFKATDVIGIDIDEAIGPGSD